MLLNVRVIPRSSKNRLEWEQGSLKALQQLNAYFDFYNHKRFHQSLDYYTPAEVYFTGTLTREIEIKR